LEGSNFTALEITIKCVFVGRLPFSGQHDYFDRTGASQYINPVAPYSLTWSSHVTGAMWICSYCGTFKEASIKLMVCRCQM